MTKLTYLTTIVAAFSPILAFAQGQDFKGLVGDVTGFVLTLVPVLTGLAVLLFIWGAVDYITKAGNGADVEESKQRMMWGVVGIFVIVAIWGLVALLGNSIGFSV